MRSAEEEQKAFLDHIRVMIGYWASDIPVSNVDPNTSKRDALEGLAFSILVALDGESAAVGGYSVRALSGKGEPLGPDIAGELHNLFYEKPANKTGL